MARCSQCNRSFSSDQALRAHCRDKDHGGYCAVCRRFFVHSTALQQHLNNSPLHLRGKKKKKKTTLLSPSGVHKPYKFKCPLCPKAFKFPSSIALHIESGCHDIHRHQVTAAVHSLKVVPTISLSHRLLGTSGASTSRAITCYSASRQAFNGSAYKCYVCNRLFRTLRSLNAHLNSPAHDADEFKCPKCNKMFKLISGLVQHIESEACGMAKLHQVEDYARALTGRFSRKLTY